MLIISLALLFSGTSDYNEATDAQHNWEMSK